MNFKLQEASRREVSHIATGTGVCTAVMLVVFFALSMAKVCIFDYTVLLAAVGGAAVAVANFALMCLMVQNVAGLEDSKEIKKRVTASYNRRLFLQGLWCLAAYLAPCFQVVAGIVPLFFPKIVIFYMQATGKFKKPDTK